MADEAHQYETTVEWRGERRGSLQAGGRATIDTGAPAEFGGSDDVWSPEHLCVAAVNACVLQTFLVIAANSKVPFRSYKASAVGTLEKLEGGGPVISRIIVRPRVGVGPEVDRSRVERILKMAEKHCYISNSMRAQVTLEPEVVVE